ncbi:MAG: mevalonate kinase [Chloroflexi bacterium]|nr:mevalonate kinase [Chloroflexota bacterium]
MIATAPGKIILVGEHAVVYGRPAIAVPVSQVSARVAIEDHANGLLIRSRDLNRIDRYSDLDPTHPLAAIIRLTLSTLGEAAAPKAILTLDSSIPIASGLGSGAAVSTAIVRALAKYYGRNLDPAVVSSLVHEVEKIHHGTPSGIDNTVIAFERPVFFCRQPPIIETLSVPRPFRLAIGNTGIASPTKNTVGDVRRAWEADREKHESLFDACGIIARHARTLIESGETHHLGPLMIDNHRLLREMGVSCAELDALVEAALNAGALGAKLSGGGRGGNMIALITDETEARVKESLLNAGAPGVIVSEVSSQ